MPSPAESLSTGRQGRAAPCPDPRSLDALIASAALLTGPDVTGTPSGTSTSTTSWREQPSALIVVGDPPAMARLRSRSVWPATPRSRRPAVVGPLPRDEPARVSQRCFCSESRVDSKNVRDGKLTEADWKKISPLGRLAEAPSPSTTPPRTVMRSGQDPPAQSRLGKLAASSSTLTVDYRPHGAATAGRGGRITVDEDSRPRASRHRHPLSQLSRTSGSPGQRPMLATSVSRA